jgi:hypothetical protein
MEYDIAFVSQGPTPSDGTGQQSNNAVYYYCLLYYLVVITELLHVVRTVFVKGGQHGSSALRIVESSSVQRLSGHGAGILDTGFWKTE